ncbi:MAG: cupin domain-containing protein [Candidatus Thorarchaeota archaeon]
MIPITSLDNIIKEIDGRPWHPIDVAIVNDQVVRMALVKGEYHWHKHNNEDELFYVVRGKMTIRMKDDVDIKLVTGETVVIPKGVEHCPKSDEDTYVLLFEPMKLKTKGD